MIWMLLLVVILQLVLLIMLLNRVSYNRDRIGEIEKELSRKKDDTSDIKNHIESRTRTLIGNRAILRNIENRLSVIEATLKDCELVYEHYIPEEEEYK
ncbi:hypothetical protein ACU6ZT_16250 [Klebsiella aerogenes]